MIFELSQAVLSSFILVFIFTVWRHLLYWECCQSSQPTLWQEMGNGIFKTFKLISYTLIYFDILWSTTSWSHRSRSPLFSSHTATGLWIDRMDQKGVQQQRDSRGGGFIHAMILIQTAPRETLLSWILFSLVAGTPWLGSWEEGLPL